MMTQGKQPQSIFPDYIREQPMVDKQGKLIDSWDVQLGALFQALQANFKNEGILFPTLTAQQISDIQAIYTPYIGLPLPQDSPIDRTQMILPDISGQTVFDSDNRIPKQFIITFNTPTPPDPPIVLSAQWLIINVMLIYVGTIMKPTPTGNLAGQLYWLCFNTFNTTLYICTTSGSITTAVWTAI